MEPLIILLAAFLVALISIRLIKKIWMPGLSGRIALSVMLVVTGVAHFLYPKGMVLMLPEFIPFKTELVYFTGIIEMSAALGLLIPRFLKLTAWLLIVFFIMILPANIYAALKHVNIRTAAFDGDGTRYLWFRIPLQVFFITWTYYFGIKKVNE